ncbi:hypothetical protein [Aquimarina longa]|uniref:hypothetical protein n=1 Tax=Aquimarina longa TaxID=1080221 RepID=UPI0011DFBBDB|nr:hypothetical protein [Aquimarina longa]
MKFQIAISYWATVLLSVFVFCGSCAQDHKKNNMKRPIERLYSNVDSLDYTTMPQYFIEGYQSGCFYEIYINGILIFEHYENVGLMNHATPINSRILQSGIQKVTIKLFPLGKINNKEYTTIDADDSFRLKIFKRDKKQPYEAGAYDIVKEHYAPLTDGLPYYEETFTFEAEVPYQLNGWSESQVLIDMDPKELEQEILDFYKEYDDIIQNQDEKKWVDMATTRELEYLKSAHYNDSKNSGIRSRINHFINVIDSDFIEPFPMDKYKIIFGGDGKVVTLKSIDRKGRAAYSYGVEVEMSGKMRKERQSKYLHLHKPKGSNKLEIIR